jgi:hypothetical protein
MKTYILVSGPKMVRYSSTKLRIIASLNLAGAHERCFQRSIGLLEYMREIGQVGRHIVAVNHAGQILLLGSAWSV